MKREMFVLMQWSKLPITFLNRNISILLIMLRMNNTLIENGPVH